jgi:hypothetical protein
MLNNQVLIAKARLLEEYRAKYPFLTTLQRCLLVIQSFTFTH